MSMNVCCFSGVCVSEPKSLRSQDGRTYAMFSIDTSARIREEGSWVEQNAVVDLVLFGAGRCRYLCDKVKRGTRVSVEASYAPTEIRDKNGRLKTIPVFIVKEFEFFDTKDESWHSSDWF